MTLTTRARRAADLARRADPTGFDHRFADPIGWKVRAHHATTLACLLGIDPANVTVRSDPVRTYGGSYPVPLLQVMDTAPAAAGQRHAGDDEQGSAQAGEEIWFVPETADPAVFLALGGCPECRGMVPIARIVHLADLGAALSGSRATPGEPTGALVGRLPDEFTGDPGHSPTCPHHRS